MDKKSLGNLPKEVVDQLPDYTAADFSTSDHWVGRNISCLIKLSWTEDEVRQRATKMAAVIKDCI